MVPPQNFSGGGREKPVCQGMLSDAGNKTSSRQAGWPPHFPADPCSIYLLTWGLVAAENPRPLKKNIRSNRRPLFVAVAVLAVGFFEWEPSPSSPRVASQRKLLSATFHLRFISPSQVRK